MQELRKFVSSLVRRAGAECLRAAENTHRVQPRKPLADAWVASLREVHEGKALDSLGPEYAWVPGGAAAAVVAPGNAASGAGGGGDWRPGEGVGGAVDGDAAGEDR